MVLQNNFIYLFVAFECLLNVKSLPLPRFQWDDRISMSRKWRTEHFLRQWISWLLPRSICSRGRCCHICLHPSQFQFGIHRESQTPASWTLSNKTFDIILTTYWNHIGNHILNIVQHFFFLQITSWVNESNFVSETFEKAFGVWAVVREVALAELERDIITDFNFSYALPRDTASFGISR